MTHTIPNYTMPHDHMNFIGQRADKMVVKDVKVKDGALVKDIEYYTVSCPECDAPGYYDERGDIICESCGMVLGGEPVIPTEHGTDASDDGGQDMEPASRGLGTSTAPPIPDPAPQQEEFYNA